MKIVINEDDQGRVVRTLGAFNVYMIEVETTYGIRHKHTQPIILNRENALRIQEDLRLWLKEHPE